MSKRVICVDAGNFIEGHNNKPMLVMENNSRLRLRVAIPEQYSTTIPQGKTLIFRLQAYPGKQYEAIFSRRSGTIDPITRSETWEFLYDNNNQSLKSGMYVNTSINVGRSENSLAVPNTAIINNLEKKYVIAIRSEKTIQIPIQIGFKTKEQAEIFGALNEGDTLLLKPNDEMKDGIVAKVKIVKQ